MNNEFGWDWKDYEKSFWKHPSEDVYYYAERWKNIGLTNLLDLGCGNGRHSIFFAEKGFNVTGTSLSQKYVDALIRNSENESLSINASLAEMVSLPFDDDSFDAILAYHSIYHTDAKGIEKVIGEMERVLRAGGEMYFSMISKKNAGFQNEEYKAIDSNTLLKHEKDGTIRPHYFVSYNEIFRLFKNFHIIRVRHVEDIYENASSFHYFIHCVKENREK